VDQAYVSPTSQSQNKDLAGMLRAEVAKSTHGRIRRLSVDCDHDRIVVRGNTSTYYAKQLALKAVRNLVPETPVQLDIKVVPRRGQA